VKASARYWLDRRGSNGPPLPGFWHRRAPRRPSPDCPHSGTRIAVRAAEIETTDTGRERSR